MANARLLGLWLSARIGITSLVVTLLQVGVSGVSAAGQCTELQGHTTGCPTVNASIQDDSVVLNGSKTRPGTAGANSGRGASTPGRAACASAAAGCAGSAAPVATAPLRDGYTVTAPVTLRDLVNFRPASGVDHMEPNGWMVVGLAANFYAVTNVQVQQGILLAQEASVRFTAVRYRWDYGDGTQRSTTTSGALWSAQGIPEFNSTATSHVYRNVGTYSIDLTIDFSAEYRYAGGAWVPVAGSIPVQANRLVATAGDAKTVLVGWDCSANPSGPGC
jgi:hypothetical protein